MKCVNREVTHREMQKVYKEKPGFITCQPKTTLEYVKVKVDVTLAPGEILKLECRHGVTGRYETFGF